MNTVELIKARHAVRSYQKKDIEPETLGLIKAEVTRINAVSGLNIQFMQDSTGVFDSMLSRFTVWKHIPYYLAFTGPDAPDLEEKCGYYGEQIVLFLQSLGLSTCWVGMFDKTAIKEKLGTEDSVVVTAVVGYGEDSGRPHKSKRMEDVTDVKNMPDWFRSGIECALLAPTAMNQQKFFCTLDGDTPSVRISENGPFVNVDLGIVKYHFEAGSGRKVF